MYREKLFNPLEKRSEQQIIAQRLRQDYGLIGEKVIELLSGDLLTWQKELNTTAQTLAFGQTVWPAVDVSDKHHPRKRIEDTKLVPVILTIHSPDDINLLKAPGVTWRDIAKHRIVRLLNEAYSQGGVLTQVEVGALLSMSNVKVHTLIAEYQKETGTDLPYRGKVHDIGPAVSHKIAIVKLMVQGHPTPDVAKKLNHSIESCDRYYKDYKKVVKLESHNVLEISALTGLSERLVKEYINLAERLDYKL